MSIKKNLVVPGEKITSGNFIAGEGVIKINNDFFSTIVGVPIVEKSNSKGKVLKVKPIKKTYIPKEDDIIIGKIIDINISNWSVDINSPYIALLPISEVFSKPLNIPEMDLSKDLKVGDMIVARVISFNLTKDVILTIRESKLGKVPRGLIVDLNLLQAEKLKENEGELRTKIDKKADCKIIIGDNFRLLIIGKNTADEVKAFELINEYLGEDRI